MIFLGIFCSFLYAAQRKRTTWKKGPKDGFWHSLNMFSFHVTRCYKDVLGESWSFSSFCVFENTPAVMMFVGRRPATPLPVLSSIQDRKSSKILLGLFPSHHKK